jgi:hypothetical protein
VEEPDVDRAVGVIGASARVRGHLARHLGELSRNAKRVTYRAALARITDEFVVATKVVKAVQPRAATNIVLLDFGTTARVMTIVQPTLCPGWDSNPHALLGRDF